MTDPTILSPQSKEPGAPVATANPDHQPRVPIAAGSPPYCSCGWVQPDPRKGLLADHLREMDPTYGKRTATP